MRHTLMMLVMCAALATPVLAMADDQTLPPEANWTPTPPVRSAVGGNQLTSLLVDTGMITAQESAQLTHPQVSSPSQQNRARAWIWDEIDRNPIRSTGGD